MPSNNEPLETELVQIDPRDLSPLERNARAMKERDFRQLVANIERDGVLLGAVVIHEKDGRHVILSGNHRVKASIAAGLRQITAIRIVSPITDARAVAIQLSQNAIVGEDDKNILQELYDSLDVLEQQYSGLTDTDLGILDDPDFDRLRLGPPKYEEVVLAFLPEDREEFEAEMQALAERSKAKRIYRTRFADYEAFFQAMMRTKDVCDITNDAVTLAVMIQLATERLDQLEAETESETEDSKAEARPAKAKGRKKAA